MKTARIISTYDKKHNRNKYGNQPTEVDGILFDSKKEANRWMDLKLMLQAGEIRDLQRQVRFELLRACPPLFPRPLTYIADFVYKEANGGKWCTVIEDVKSKATRENRVYIIKKRLMYQILGWEIREL